MVPVTLGLGTNLSSSVFIMAPSAGCFWVGRLQSGFVGKQLMPQMTCCHCPPQASPDIHSEETSPQEADDLQDPSAQHPLPGQPAGDPRALQVGFCAGPWAERPLEAREAIWVLDALLQASSGAFQILPFGWLLGLPWGLSPWPAQ